MSSLATVFELNSAKNCFISIKNGKKKQDRSGGAKIMVYEAVVAGHSPVFFSLSGDGAAIQSGDTVTVNGLYAEKLGIRDKQEVILKAVNGSLITAQKVSVEPVSVDDWEILERSAGQVENKLLDQVRVVWEGQVLPVWVEQSICVFITVVSMEPRGCMAVLDTNTMVLVSPKTRSHSDSSHRPPSLKMPSRQDAQDMTGKTPTFVGQSGPPLKAQWPISPSKVAPSRRLQPNSVSPRKVYRKSGASTGRRDTRSDPMMRSESDSKPIVRRHTDKERHMRSVFVELVSSLMGYSNQQKDAVVDSGYDEVDAYLPEVETVPQDNLVYRIQSSDLAGLYHTVQTALDRQAYEDDVDGNDLRAPGELLQPSTIYVSAQDTWGNRLGGGDGQGAPRVYYAELRKLLSAQDQEKARIEAKKPGDKGKEQAVDSPTQKAEDAIRCIVRVVTVERSAAVTPSPWDRSALVVLAEHGLAAGHAVVPTELRRQLKLDVTGCVWVKAGHVHFQPLGAIILYPISVVPRAVDDRMLRTAFKVWVESVADEQHPLVVFHGILVKFRVTSSVSVEAQLCLGSGQNSCCLLDDNNVQSATVIIQRQTKDDQPLPGVLNPMLAYRRCDDFDPKKPTEKLSQLGGVSGLTISALRHLEACLGSRPLPQRLFGGRPGLNHGLLLLTGPKGSGKTSLAAALCSAVSAPPTLAFTFTVDCKPLRGKRVETIQMVLEKAFDEAAWRQPAVIVLDDLDVVAPSSDNPAAEMSGEAVYAAKVTEVLEGLLKFEMRNFSRLAVIVTSQSRSSLHPAIVASRGLHFVQEVTTIKPPDKAGRTELLRSILKSHSTVGAKATLERVDVEAVAAHTEGFVARDLQTVVNRALHCRMAAVATVETKNVILQQGDFDAALEGFKPLAIRNVPLHTAGELGWGDIGGLEGVKGSLVETLQWPSKYPELFASCPLRLRSGLLLYGPPGTGKTLLAGAVARECNLNFISIKGPELLSKYIGASEQAVRDLFVRAQSAKPCILFFDEFDSIAPKRGHDSTGVTDRVVNQLLTQLDGVEGLQGVYMLAATSRPDLIDPALLRPGRLDKCLFCNIPTKEERRSILKALTQKMCLCDDVDLDTVANSCEFFTGADFKALLYNAQLQAIHEFTDAERVLGDSMLRIGGSPDSCAMVTKPPITINTKRSPLSSITTPPIILNSKKSPLSSTPISITKRPTTLSDGGDVLLDGKMAAVVTLREASPGPAGDAGSVVAVPGPAGDADVVVDAVESRSAPSTACSPPRHLLLGQDLGQAVQRKSQSVTFFPKMGDGPALLTPEDEARFLSMVETIHRRQTQLLSRDRRRERRASSVLAKPSVLIPVRHSHLLAAASALKPSVSASERLRYQAIYDNFVSGRQGDFATGNQQTGMRTTLA